MKKLILLLILIMITGCNKDKIEIVVEMNCNDSKSEVKVKYNDTLYCKVNDKEYSLLVTDINEEEIVLKYNKKEYRVTINKNFEKDNFKLSWKK